MEERGSPSRRDDGDGDGGGGVCSHSHCVPSRELVSSLGDYVNVAHGGATDATRALSHLQPSLFRRTVALRLHPNPSNVFSRDVLRGILFRSSRERNSLQIPGSTKNDPPIVG